MPGDRPTDSAAGEMQAHRGGQCGHEIGVGELQRGSGRRHRQDRVLAVRRCVGVHRTGQLGGPAIPRSRLDQPVAGLPDAGQVAHREPPGLGDTAPDRAPPAELIPHSRHRQCGPQGVGSDDRRTPPAQRDRIDIQDDRAHRQVPSGVVGQDDAVTHLQRERPGEPQPRDVTGQRPDVDGRRRGAHVHRQFTR